MKAFGVILKYWLIDDLYQEPYGRAFLNNLTGTPQYLNWMTRTLRPYVGNTVLELGAGIGNLTGRLMGRRLRYVATESNPLYLHTLQNRFLRTPNVSVARLDPAKPCDYAPFKDSFESVLCINVLEYAEDPAAGFRPSPGRITDFHMPGGFGVRVDTHSYAGYVVPPYYDSLIAKLVVYAQTRQGAVNKMASALEEFTIEGIKTTIPFHRQVMEDERFRSGNFDTSFLDSFTFTPRD